MRRRPRSVCTPSKCRPRPSPGCDPARAPPGGGMNMTTAATCSCGGGMWHVSRRVPYSDPNFSFRGLLLCFPPCTPVWPVSFLFSFCRPCGLLALPLLVAGLGADRYGSRDCDCARFRCQSPGSGRLPWLHGCIAHCMAVSCGPFCGDRVCGYGARVYGRRQRHGAPGLCLLILLTRRDDIPTAHPLSVYSTVSEC